MKTMQAAALLLSCCLATACLAQTPKPATAMFVHKDGRVKAIAYWCDVCWIRTYTPGPCWRCQKETLLDLRDPDEDR
jgi:hypothetical protein